MPTSALGKAKPSNPSYTFARIIANTSSSSASAAKDALSDKVDEHGHNAKADAHKEYAKA